MARARRRGAGRRADLRWVLGRGTLLTLSGGATAGATVISAGNTSQTIMRTRGRFAVWLDPPLVVGDLVAWAVGLLIVPGLTGTTVTSSPLTDPEAPFYWYESGHLAAETTADADGEGIKVVTGIVDVKAMRILRPDQEVQMVAEMSDITQTSEVNFHGTFRTLIAD